MYRTNVQRIGFGLLVAAALSYLAGIWTTETTSEHFGMTGVLFMFSGIAALVTAAFLPDLPAKRR